MCQLSYSSTLRRARKLGAGEGPPRQTAPGVLRAVNRHKQSSFQPLVAGNEMVQVVDEVLWRYA